MKLKKKDIIIISEGIQVGKAILAKYHSIDEFITANNFLYMPSTVRRHCNSSVIDSSKFKINLMLALGKDYREIVSTKEEQIQTYCWHFFKNIYDYNKEDDKEVLEYVTELCRENGMNLEYALMHRNMGYYYYNVNNMEACVLMFGKCIELLEQLCNYNYKLVCLCDLGLIYIQQYDYSKALEVFEMAEKIATSGFEVEQKYLYLYYYRKGIVLNRIGQFREARALFEESLKYTEDRHWIGFSLNNIGLTWKNEGNFDKALESYLSQLEIFTGDDDDERIQICTACNNIASLYRVNRNFKEALYYIDLAFNHAPKSRAEYAITAFITYAEIKYDLEKELDIVDKLFELLDDIDAHIKIKSYIIKAIQVAIDIYVKSNNDKFFWCLSDLLITLIDNTDTNNSAYLKELKVCYADLCYVRVKGGKNHV